MTRRLGLLLTVIAIAAIVLSVPVAAKTKITIYDWASGKSSEGIQLLIQEFNATHPDIEVVYAYKGPSSQALMEALTVGLMGNAPPEISVVFETHVQQLQPFMEHIVPVERFISADRISKSEMGDFLPMALTALQANGVQVALPFRFEGSMLAVNVDLLQQAGMTQYPRTWEAVMAQGAKLSRDIDGDGTPDILAAGWVNPAAWVWAPFLWGAGGEFFSKDNTQARFGSPAGVRAGEFFYELIRSGIGVTNGNFAGGRVTSAVMGSWETVPFLENARFQWEGAFWPYPADIGPESVRGLSKVGGLLIFKTTPAKEQAAWTFARWMTQPENLARYDVLASWLPVRRSAASQGVFQAEMRRNPGLRAFMENLDRFKLTPSFDRWVTIDFDIIRPTLTRIVKGQEPAKTALEEAQRLADEKLKAK